MGLLLVRECCCWGKLLQSCCLVLDWWCRRGNNLGDKGIGFGENDEAMKMKSLGVLEVHEVSIVRACVCI